MSTGTHPIAPEELMGFLDGELPGGRAAAVSAHLETCSDCKELNAQLRTTSQSLAKWTIPTSPDDAESEKLIAVMLVAAGPAQLSHRSLIGFFRRGGWQFASAFAALVVVLLWAGSAHFYRARHDTFDSFVGGAKRDSRVNVTPLDTLPYQGNLPAGSVGGGGGGDAINKGYYVHKIPFQAQPGFAMADSQRLPMIARTVSLSVVVKDFDASRASLDAILTRHSGYAANLSVSTPQGTARVIQASLRIPAPQLAQAASELKALGRVENENQNGEEVTQQHADLVARLKNSRETEQRLQDVLRTRTGKVKDVLEVEEEIARVRGEIEQTEAEQKTLEHRVEFATIDLKLAEEYKAQLSTPAPSVLMQLRNATVNGFRNAFESLLALVLFLAESGPNLLLWLAILGLPAWRLWRRYRRAQSLGSLAGA